MDPAKQREIASKGGKASHGGGRKAAARAARRSHAAAGRAIVRAFGASVGAATRRALAALTGLCTGRTSTARDKGGAIAAVIAIHAALLFAFLILSGKIDLAEPQSVLAVFDVTASRRRRPSAAAEAQAQAEGQGGRVGAEEHQERSDAGGCAKAEDRRAAAAQIAAAETPRQGTAADPGRVRRARARHRRRRHRQRYRQRRRRKRSGRRRRRRRRAAAPRTPVLTGRDFPRDHARNGRAARLMFLRLRIEPQRPCRAGATSCAPSAIAIGRPMDLCSLIVQRGVFPPALDARGVPVAGMVRLRSRVERQPLSPNRRADNDRSGMVGV